LFVVESAHKSSQSSTAARGGDEIPQNADIPNACNGVGHCPICLGAAKNCSADLKVSATTAVPTSAKPFTEEQVSNMVRDGFGDESGARLIEQRGIDFAPADDLLQTLKAGGASEAFLNALRAAKSCRWLIASTLVP
jgi:hypothetical protein